jgi:hypothetical protein
MGGSGETVKNFLTTLAENNRLGVLESVCEKFAQLMSAHKGEVEMVVTSAGVRNSNKFDIKLTMSSLWIKRSSDNSKMQFPRANTLAKVTSSRSCPR